MKSSRLRLREVQAAFQVVGECRDVGHDPDGWTAHLVAALPGLIRSQMLMVGEFTWAACRPVPRRLVDAGWPSERGRVFWQNWVRQPGAAEQPALAAFAARSSPRGACTRRELVADREWEASPHVNDVLRPAEIDDGMVSAVPLVNGEEHLIVLARVYKDRPFGPRERNLVRLLHAELARHLGRGLATSDDPAAELTPRLREVLDCLLDGDPEKRIARRLGVTPGTLHGYVKRVYRAFGVRSRAELLAHFLRRYRRG